MVDSANQLMLSGTVHSVFEERETSKGDPTRSLLLNYQKNGRDKRIYVVAFGERNVEAIGNLEEGNYVIVQGMLDEQNWQDDDKEWHSRTQIVLSKLVNLGELELDEDGPPDE